MLQALEVVAQLDEMKSNREAQRLRQGLLHASSTGTHLLAHSNKHPHLECIIQVAFD